MSYPLRKVWKTFLAAWVGCLLTLGSVSGAVFAQGSIQVLRSDPADGAVLSTSPTHVQVWFSSGLDPHRSLLLVYNEKGRQVDLGSGGVDQDDPNHASMLVTVPHLINGVYSVRWHAVLETGGSADGQFTFTVGSGTQTRLPTLAAVSGNTPTTGFPSAILIGAVGILLAVIAAGLFFFLRRSTHSS